MNWSEIIGTEFVPEKVKRDSKATLINTQTNTFEWVSTTLTDKQCNDIARILKAKKPQKSMYQSIKNAQANGKTATQIARIYRGQKGFGISNVKRVLAALSKI